MIRSCAKKELATFGTRSKALIMQNMLLKLFILCQKISCKFWHEIKTFNNAK